MLLGIMFGIMVTIVLLAVAFYYYMKYEDKQLKKLLEAYEDSEDKSKLGNDKYKDVETLKDVIKDNTQVNLERKKLLPKK